MSGQECEHHGRAEQADGGSDAAARVQAVDEAGVGVRDQLTPSVRGQVRGCLGLRIARTHRLVTRIFEQALRPLGLTLPQLELLSTLTIVGRPIKPTELADLTAVERSTTSRNLAVMQARGWVTPADVSPTGRAMTISITTAGSGSSPRPAPPGNWPRPAPTAHSARTRLPFSTSGSANSSPPAPEHRRPGTGPSATGGEGTVRAVPGPR